ncbi:uncharacterized protein LOC101737115 [Bombyx mori]|uniref:MADF domain-containing protein n=1 Tax=Bombyx mori TaxID=7091 RepID=A0A8R1WP74_BOMMO|nr:uncharacterized protein LOC101737115 [Bombyx mori]
MFFEYIVKMLEFNPVCLIEEIQKRPGLYSSECPADREEKLALWKEVGSSMFPDWDTINKATAYDRVLQLQRKWRSLRDAYNRELRARRSGVRIHKRTYRHFKRMIFLGGYEGPISDGDSDSKDEDGTQDNSGSNPETQTPEPIEPPKKVRRKKRKRQPSCDTYPTQEVEMPVFPVDIDSTTDTDSDKLFLLSFLPEMRQLPVHLKMWVRSQIANTMQEAVTNHYNSTKSFGMERSDIKRPRKDSTE